MSARVSGMVPALLSPLRLADAKFVTTLHCNETKMAVFNGIVILCCPHQPPLTLINGKLEELQAQPVAPARSPV